MKCLGTVAAAVSLLGWMAMAAPAASAGGDKWVCSKDGAEVKVKGKNAKAKQKKCEEKGGTWEKQGGDKSGGGSAEAPAPEDKGGGGW